MPGLKITANVTQEECAAVQREFFTRGEWTLDRERYNSPNGESALVLESKGEIAFGPRMFAAYIRTENEKSVELSSKSGKHSFLSPGRYGQGYDHWDGDPWSPDSNQIAIFDFLQRQPSSFGGGSLFDVSSGKWTRFADGPGVWSHHMWSPTGGHYLFRDLKNWHILDATTGKSRHLAAVNRYPCHAYFLSADHVLLLEDSFRIMSVKALELLAEESHPDVDLHASDRYSLYDSKRNRVLLGVGTSIGEVVTCRKWYAIEMVAMERS
jgi:hypothetical protein